MTPRKSPPQAETENDQVVDALQTLNASVEDAAEKLELVAYEISRVRDEIRNLVDKGESPWPRETRKLPLDPASPNWSSELKELNEKPIESVFCTCCPAKITGIADALRAGWSCVVDNEGCEQGNYAGHCGQCTERMEAEEATAPEYRIRTYDVDAGEYTAQQGVEEVVSGQIGLRKALRTLQDMGYSCDRSGGSSDPSVLVERIESEKPNLSAGPSAVCDVCEREVPHEQAKKEKWTDLARWNGGGHAAFLGICPGCISAPEKPKKAKKSLFPND